MADGSVKIDIIADDSDVQKKVNDVEDSFDGLGNKQKENQQETQKTKSKFDELTETINKQEKELTDLKGEYTQAIINFGKGSAEVKELEGKMSSLNTELGKNKDTYEKAQSAAEKMTSVLNENGEGFNVAGIALGNFISDGIQNLISSLGDAVQSLFALSEETREYREDMAKLDSAFTTAGHSTETANEAYTSFYKILGESDRSVEAVNHLAELTKNEEEVAKWSTIAAGVTAKFGDSLPIEGLTEAANETAKVGQVTGPLADALNWAGISEDEFNKKLAACNSEQERATLITETLNSEYAAAAAEYNELTASTQAAREATSNMEQAQADLGAAVEPLTTAWTNLKAQGLEAIRPVIEAISGKFSELMGWLQEHPAVLATVTGALAALGIALGVVTAAVIAQTVAQWAQNAAWLASPITWIILAIVVAIGALVGAFLYLWNNCDSFREFFTNMWEGIKSAVSTAWEAIKGFFVAAWDAIKSAWSACVDFFSGLWDGIVSVFSVVGQWFSDIFTAAWEGIKNAWSAVVDFFSGLWDGIVSVFSVVASWFSGVFSSAWNGIVSIWNAVVGFFSGIWNGIVSVFSAVGSWFSGVFSAAWNGIKSVWSGVTSFFSGIWNGIKNVFSDAFQTFLSIGKNIVDGIKQGIKNAWANLKSWFSGLFGDLKSIAKKILGINSPSKEFAYIGDMIVEGLEKGIDDNRNKAINAIGKLATDTIGAMQANAEKEIATIENQLEERQKTYEQADKDLEKQRNKNNADAIDAQREALKEQYELDKEALQDQLDVAKEREKSISSYANTLEKQLDNMVKIEEDYVADVAKVHEDLEKDIEAANKRYEDAFANRVESIKSGLSLFDKAEKGDAVTGTDLIKNLKSQNSVLTDYNTALDKLSERGINQAFVDELKGMGIDALPQLEAINKMSDKQLEEYVALWEEKNKLATEAATDELATMREETAKEIDQLKIDAGAKLDGLRDQYRKDFVLLITEMGQSMTEAGDAGLAALGAQIGKYTKNGAALVDGIIEGVESQESKFVSAMVASVMGALNAAKEAAGIHSPSKVMRDQVGKNLGLGMIEGWKDKVADMKKTMSLDMSKLTENLRATVMMENARFATNTGAADTGFADLARAVGIQTAGINSLAGEYRRGSGTMRPIIIELDGRELGHAFVDTGGTETVRIGSKISLGGAKG